MQTSFDVARAQGAIRRGLITVALTMVAIGLAVLALSRSELGAEAISGVLSRARLGPLAVSWLGLTAAFYFMGLRWRALMPPPHHPPAAGLTSLICAGLLLNYTVPGPFGELGAAWFAWRRYAIPLADALASGVAARLVGLATAALMALGIWLVVDLPVPADQSAVLDTARELAVVAVVVLGIGGVALFWLALQPGWWKGISNRLLGRATGQGRMARGARQLDAGVSALADALSEVATRGLRPYARAIAWSCICHTSVIVGICIAVEGLGAEPAISGLAFTYAATTAGAVALFALPGSQLGWDALFFSLLVAFAGLSAPDALAIALLVRVQQLSLMIIGAGSLAWLLRTTPPAPAEAPPPQPTA